VLIKDHFKDLNVEVNDFHNLEDIEAYLIDECDKRNIELSHDTMAEEPLNFKSIGYGYCAGSIIAYPQSTAAYNTYLIEAISPINQSKYNDNTSIFANPIDKYKAKEEFSATDLDTLVVLPGTNILRSLVDRNLLYKLAKEGAYAKIHPITVPEDIEELTRIFDKKIIGNEYGLYNLFNKAENIYTTTASETAIYATMNNKNLYSLEEAGHKFKGAYSPIINFLFWTDNKEDRKQLFNALYNSSISNIFNPKDNYKLRIDNFLNKVGKKCQQ